MPAGLRFCRNCGFRLGEGSAEYTETVRFQNGVGPITAANAAIPYSAPIGAAATTALGKVGACSLVGRKRMSGMFWIFIGLVIFFACAGALTRLARPHRSLPPIIQVSNRSYVGVNEFDTTDGGVTFGDVEPPGSPADRAGLVGGDVITSFDGQRIESDDQIMELLGKTPVGRTVEVIYQRDGETKTTRLTTMAKGEFDELRDTFRNRPEGKGRLGVDNQTEVAVPGTNLHGVRCSVQASMPADMAGLKNGDIIVTLDSVPIRTEEELASRIQRALPYSTVDIEVFRGSERLKIPVKMGRR